MAAYIQFGKNTEFLS